MTLTFPLTAGKRYTRRDGTVTPPLTGGSTWLEDLETRFLFQPKHPFVRDESAPHPKDIVSDCHETRDGRPVRILATDVKHPVYPVVAVIMDPDGDENVYCFTADGRYYDDGDSSNQDIVTLAPTLQLEVGKVYQTEDEDNNRFEIVHYVPIKDIFIGIDSSSDVYGFHPNGTCTTDHITLTKELP